MTKRTRLIACLLCLLGFGFLSEAAQHVLIGDLYYNLDETNKTAEVTYQVMGSSTNYAGLTNVAIPDEVEYNSENYSVTSIGDGAFESCSTLTSVVVGSDVTFIGMFAFSSCTSLTSVMFTGSTPPDMGDFVFNGITMYALSVFSDDESKGTVSGGGMFKAGTTQQISANPTTCYTFDKWNDGNTENPRPVTMDGDKSFTAHFKPITYIIRVETADASQGSVHIEQ